MVLKAEALMRSRDRLAGMYERAMNALKNLNVEGIQALETTDGNVIVGMIVGMKSESMELLVKVIAAKEVDYKLRNLESKGIKRRTYPLPLHNVVSSKTLEQNQVPLYVNYGFISTQFKNKFFNGKS